MHARTWLLVSCAALSVLAGSACDNRGQSPVAPDDVQVDPSGNPNTGANTPPVITSVTASPPSILLNETSTLNARASDADGDSVTCTWSLDSGGQVTPRDASCEAVLRPTQTGTLHVRVQARDSRGAVSVARTVDVAVGRTARPTPPQPEPNPEPEPKPTPNPNPNPNPNPTPSPSPVPTPGPNPNPTPSPSPSPTPTPGPGNRPPNVQITTAQGSCTAPCQIQVTAQGSDPDSDRITLHFSGCASGDFGGATATTVCDVPTASTFTATVTARDGLGASSQASVTVSGVASTNRPPSVTTTAEKQTCHPLPDRPCEILVSAQASDPDGDVLSYEWSGCATGRGGTATCRVAALADATATVVVRDTRGARASSSVTMRGVNSAPGGTPSAAVTGCHPYPNTCAVDVAGDGTDPDGDPLTYTWSGCASGTGAAAKCAVPAESTDVHSANVVISDGWTSVLRGVSVRGLNSPPLVTVSSSSPGCHPRPGAPCFVTVSAHATDPDGDPVSLSWSGCAAGTRTPTQCDVTEPGRHLATVTVKDPFGATRSNSITVTGTNNAPITVASPATATGNAATFRWEWDDADSDVLHCVFGVQDPTNCTYAGNCQNTGNSAKGSVTCDARTRVATDPPAHCAYGLQCYDGWTSSIGVFQLN